MAPEARPPCYVPDDEEAFQWSFPPRLPPDGWESTARPLNTRDRRRLRWSLACQSFKILYGVAMTALGAAGVLIGSQAHDTAKTIFFGLFAMVFFWYSASELRRLFLVRRTLTESRILVVRYRRPEGAEWPEEMSPAAEYLEATRELWDDHPGA